MKSKKVFLVFIMVLSLFSLPGCKGLIPSSFEIETTSELGPNTLNRIDDINDTLATGMEIGPETRATIEELNQTIDDGLEFGFTESTLQRVDVLLGMVEQGVGVKAGLDAETNQTVNNLIDTLGDQPGQWEDTMTSIITTLEGSSSRVAEQMADEVEGLMVEARLNTQELSASMGAEFRCNVDFMSTRAGDTLDQFIGRSLVGRLRSIVSGEELEEETEDEIPIPRVCQMVPDQVDLEEIDEKIEYNDVIKISGYNFVEENKPHAYVADADGNPLPDIELYPPVRSTSYQLQLNLQGIDFSSVPAGSIMILEWPVLNVGDESAKNELSILLPSEEPKPKEEIRAEVTIDVDTLDVRVGPGEEYAALDEIAVRGATYEITGHNGGKTWWQIEFNRDLGWVPDEAVTAANTELVGPVSVPKDPPQAAFSMEPQGGNAPLVIEFWDMSSGDPTSWEWWVIPEGGDERPVEGGKETSYQFTEAGNYTVRLRVNNELGADEAEKSFIIGELEIVEEPEDEEEQEEPEEEEEPPPPPPEYNANSFVFKNYDRIQPNVPHPTGISAADYNCAIVSMKAIQGNLACNNYEDIMDAYLQEGNDGNWEILANIRTHNNHERWSTGVMCVDKDKSMTVEVEFTPSEVPDEGYSLEGKGIPGNYTCVISGFDIGYGSPANSGAGDIIKVFTRKTEGNWHVTADFFNDGNDEDWEVDVMCFYRDPDLILDYDHSKRMRITDYQPVAFDANTFSQHAIELKHIDSRRYACGVAGMEAVNGTIECDGSHNLIESYTFVDRKEYKWYAYANFYSRGSGEEWNLDLICVDRSIVDIDMSRWVVLWPDR